VWSFFNAVFSLRVIFVRPVISEADRDGNDFFPRAF
jgi:hypothetical protein